MSVIQTFNQPFEASIPALKFKAMRCTRIRAGPQIAEHRESTFVGASLQIGSVLRDSRARGFVCFGRLIQRSQLAKDGRQEPS